MPITRTLGPLHFEDLEPKRFEDLVRQLCYDFKSWRRLEATGRSGSDDGFDARGYEIVQGSDERSSNEEELEFEDKDRLWLIQCKRERVISPAKLGGYLDNIGLISGDGLHGLLFAAACDFSKKARDKFRDHCEGLGIQEWHLWGKAELEDLLYQPRNDALLFAYFGVSLKIRQRNQRSEIRSRLAMKRKAHKALDGIKGTVAMLRSPDAKLYPNSNEIPDFKLRPQWFMANYEGFSHSGLLFGVRRHFAFLNDERNLWDAAFSYNDWNVEADPWAAHIKNWELRQEIYDVWNEFPKNNQAWFELMAVVPFEAILDIDEIGDEYVRAPHIYVPFELENGPFSNFVAYVTGASSWNEGSLSPTGSKDRRVSHFKEEWRSEVYSPYSGGRRVGD